MGLKHVGMKGQSLQFGKLLQIDIDREVEPAVVNGTLLQSAGNIAQGFADIGCRELDAVFLEGIWQQTERGFLNGAFTSVWIRRFLVVGLLVFLRQCNACGRGKQDDSYEPTSFQNAARDWLRRGLAVIIN